MLTNALVSLALREAPDWSRAEILGIVNDINYLIMAKEISQTKIVDTTTGKDKLLTTVSGTCRYVIDVATNGFPYNAFSATNVYVSDPDIPTKASFKEYDGTTYATVIFEDDPGIGSYYVTCYKVPTTISTESTVLDVPPKYHLTHVLPGVIGQIEMVDGGVSDRWQEFYNKLLPDLWNSLNQTSFSNLSNIIRRGY